jgi:hypothetical protein
MRYIKTFESFSSEIDSERLDEGFFGDLKDKVVNWFRGIKDAVMQKAAAKIATVLEQKKSDPAVKQKIDEIQKAYAELSDADKKKFQSLFASKDAIKKTGEKLEAAGIEKVAESLRESLHSGEALNEDFESVLTAICKYLGVSTAVAGVILLAVGLVEAAGTGGYVAATLGLTGFGLPAGLFAALVCVVIIISGGMAYSLSDMP